MNMIRFMRKWMTITHKNSYDDSSSYNIIIFFNISFCTEKNDNYVFISLRTKTCYYFKCDKVVINSLIQKVDYVFLYAQFCFLI